MRLNVRPKRPLEVLSPELLLRRSVMSCLLWEDGFYEDGKSVADRIVETCRDVPNEVIASLALEARLEMHLRHVPLLLVVAMIEKGNARVAELISEVIQRPDEITELLAIYWRNGRRPLSKQLRKGLAAAFHNFDPYQFAKWNRRSGIRLRDVMFLVRPKPVSEEQKTLFRQIANDELPTADTWEVALSGGANKKETFERLLREEKLGYMALLRNLRNMAESQVDRRLVADAIRARKGAEKVLPFRYIAAARHAVEYAEAIDLAIADAVAESRKFNGTTGILVDVSSSMFYKLSAKSESTRFDVAAALAVLFHGDARLFTFSWDFVEVPRRTGMGGIEAIRNSQANSSTLLSEAVTKLNTMPFDRVIVITDEQNTSSTPLPAPRAPRAYMINVAADKKGVGYGNGWTHIDGWSDSVFRYIHTHEAG